MATESAARPPLPYRDADINDALELGYTVQEGVVWCVGFNTVRSWLDAILTEADNAR
jgi:hypothetical protein